MSAAKADSGLHALIMPHRSRRLDHDSSFVKLLTRGHSGGYNTTRESVMKWKIGLVVVAFFVAILLAANWYIGGRAKTEIEKQVHTQLAAAQPPIEAAYSKMSVQPIRSLVEYSDLIISGKDAGSEIRCKEISFKFSFSDLNSLAVKGHLDELHFLQINGKGIRFKKMGGIAQIFVNEFSLQFKGCMPTAFLEGGPQIFPTDGQELSLAVRGLQISDQNMLSADGNQDVAMVLGLLGIDLNRVPVQEITLTCRLNQGHFSVSDTKVVTPILKAVLQADININQADPDASIINSASLTFKDLSKELKAKLDILGMEAGASLSHSGQDIVLKISGSLGNPRILRP